MLTYYDISTLKVEHTTASEFEVDVAVPNAVVVQLPYTSDELWPQSSVTDLCKR